MRINWAEILTRGAEIVDSYDTSVTLRQLFYRLVSEQLLPNTDVSYKGLSARTAAGRRAGTFPELIDRGRQIHRRSTFADPADAMDALIGQYRLDRTEGQPASLYLAVEKSGLVVQLESWFAYLGIPILAVGGYASQSYVRQIVDDVPDYRPAVLLYAGDFDASGEDIDRDLVARTDCWAKVVRVALSAEQVEQYNLPPNPGKATDSRAGAFTARHGELVQVEVDALPPETLRALFAAALAPFWDTSAYDDQIAQENADVSTLRGLAERLGDDW